MVDNIKQDELPVDSLTAPKENQKEPQFPSKIHHPKYHKVVDSAYFRIALTGVMILLLFLTAFVIAVVSELRRQRAEQFDQGVPPAEVIIPTPEPTSSQTTDIDISNWKTYRSEEYGFEINHPPDWTVETWRGSIYFYGPSYPELTGDAIGGISFPENMASAIAGMGSQWVSRIIKQEEITVNGLEALVVTVTTLDTPGWKSTHVFIETNTRIYELGFDPEDPTDQAILSTFKFLE